jgi:hypothetical protein
MIVGRRSAVVALVAMAVTLLVGCAKTPPAPKTEPPNGTVELNPATTSDTMGGGGKGRVYFGGQAYRFTVGGLGIDGSAIAVIETSGEVYRLGNATQLPGTYRRLTDPPPVADKIGGLWLRNEAGTVLYLRDPPNVRLPLPSGDGLRIVLDR